MALCQLSNSVSPYSVSDCAWKHYLFVGKGQTLKVVDRSQHASKQ